MELFTYTKFEGSEDDKLLYTVCLLRKNNFDDYFIKNLRLKNLIFVVEI